MKRKGIEYVNRRNELRDLARRLKVRRDWHEPDEQGLTIRVVGSVFDNAGFYGPDLPDNLRDREEFNIVIVHDGTDIAVINIATLLGWACEPSLADDEVDALRTIRTALNRIGAANPLPD